MKSFFAFISGLTIGVMGFIGLFSWCCLDRNWRYSLVKAMDAIDESYN